MDAPEWISVSEAAQLSGYSVKDVRHIIRQGKVKAEKIKGMQEWRVDKQSLRDFVWHMKLLGTGKHGPHSDGD